MNRYRQYCHYSKVFVTEWMGRSSCAGLSSKLPYSMQACPENLIVPIIMAHMRTYAYERFRQINYNF